MPRYSIRRCGRTERRTQLTPWSRVFLEKLVKKMPAFYRTGKPITAFTSGCHLCLSSARSVHAPPSHFLKIHFNISLPYRLGSSKWSPSLRPPHETPVCTYTLYVLHSQPISLSSSLCRLLHSLVTTTNRHVGANTCFSKFCERA